MNTTRETIIEKQKNWALIQNITFNKKGYVAKLEDNLFRPLIADSEDDFIYGRGDELESKMLALHSSSALVVNFFQYWRTLNIPAITGLIGFSSRYDHMRFEKAFQKPQGIGGIKPHIDIEFTGIDKPIAVESKFTEPYSKAKKSLKNAYVNTPGIWGRYTKCEMLANLIVTGEKRFLYFDAPQLLKHILGLKTEYGEDNFYLIYLWYDIPSEESQKHYQEVQTFTDLIENEIDIQFLTYQDLFGRVKSFQSIDPEYLLYIKQRYFN